jgi:hypothetical protein
MSEEKFDCTKGHVPCEICETKPAKHMKGGINFKTGERGHWLVCQECCNKIEDNRKKPR